MVNMCKVLCAQFTNKQPSDYAYDETENKSGSDESKAFLNALLIKMKNI